jgi:LmbE family N-acetylglucosaminyl deacetylase
MKVLICAAHPDDEVLGCGGTIARLAGEGHDVYIAILGEGITARFSKRDEADADLIKTLHAASREAARLLGAKDVFMYNLPDNRFDTVPLLDVVKIIEELIERLEPEIVYTQHGGDLNVDHATVFRATLAATRPLDSSGVKELYAFEVPSATEWAFQQFAPVFHPNVFVDISATLETKILAMKCYDKEMRPFPHPRSAEGLRAVAQRAGTVAGLHAAESFQLIRQIKGRS